MTVVRAAAAQLDEVRRIFLHHVDGITDDEFRWEPVDGCWSVRERDGRWEFEVGYPEPEPAPLTTIAWLTAHMTQFLSGAEHAVRHQPIVTWPPTYGTASEAIAEWRERADGLQAALAEASDQDFVREYAWSENTAASPAGTIVWRAIYEAIHHAAEVSRMRQLYANRSGWRAVATAKKELRG